MKVDHYCIGPDCWCKDNAPARRPEDDALDRLARLIPPSPDPRRMDAISDVATVREALERQQSRIYILENMRSENYIEALESAEAEVRQLREDIQQVRLWFERAPWEGRPDPSSFGGHGPYSPAERELGYGTFRDPRFLPDALLSASPSDGGGAK